VPRARFAPVKTTADLLALRSDAYAILPDGRVALDPARDGQPPVISLSDEYKLVDGLDALGAPGLLECRSLRISGPVRIPPGTRFRGDVEITNPHAEPATLDPGEHADMKLAF